MRQRYLKIILIPGLLCPGLAMAGNLSAGNVLDGNVLEARGTTIGKISITRKNVFDPSNPEEDKWLFRLANRLHIVTRESVVRKQLLVRSGDSYSQRLADESERILRQNQYIDDADIQPVRVEDGVVDLDVMTHDLWSLAADISLSRGGGENSTRFGLEDSNLFGRGQLLGISRIDDVDRTSSVFRFEDKHLGRSWVSTALSFADNSDGKSQLVSVMRPFYSLDSRWSAGGWIVGDDREESLYVLGNPEAAYRRKRDYSSVFGGWSKGLEHGRARRWTIGFVHDDKRFLPVPDPTLLSLVPADRKLVYPFVGFEIVEDKYSSSQYLDQINRTEDVLMGAHFSASLGWSDTAFGADRDAWIYSAGASRGFGALNQEALLLSANTRGRIERGTVKNATMTLRGRYYRKQSEKRLFFASIEAVISRAPDLDQIVQLGGDTGLQGYPLRYQNGDSKLLVTAEQRYFTDWFPFRLVRVGAAIFADAGRVWGDNPLDERRFGWLADVGFGLRLALTRSSSHRVIHVDLAFPLGGDSSIDSLQILVKSRSSF